MSPDLVIDVLAGRETEFQQTKVLCPSNLKAASVA